MKQNTLTFSSR